MKIKHHSADDPITDICSGPISTHCSKNGNNLSVQKTHLMSYDILKFFVFEQSLEI